VSAGAILLWIVLPYVSVTIFVAGHVWRYRHDQFGWTSRSTQLLESRLLAWGSPLFHYGALAAIGGHVLGILIPPSATNAVGIHEHTYHLIAAIEARLNEKRQTFELAIDPADGAGLSWLYRHSEVLSKGMREDGLLGVMVRADAEKAARVRAKFGI